MQQNIDNIIKVEQYSGSSFITRILNTIEQEIKIRLDKGSGLKSMYIKLNDNDWKLVYDFNNPDHRKLYGFVEPRNIGGLT